MLPKNHEHKTAQSKVKNILFVESNLDGTVGGSHFCLLEMIRNLDRKKFKPIVLFYQNNSLLQVFKTYVQVILFDKTKGLVFQRDYPFIYQLSLKVYPFRYLLRLMQKIYNFFFYLFDFFKILTLLKRNRISIIHLNNGPALTEWLLAAKIIHIKCVGHLRGNWRIGYLHKKLLRYYDGVIAISKSVTDFVKNKGGNTANFIIIHDGIDVNAFIQSKHRNSIRINEDAFFTNCDFLIGVIGNIKPWKGQHVLIQAVNILKMCHPMIRCLIIGAVSDLKIDQEYYHFMINMVQKENLSKNIIFTGFRNDIPDLLTMLDVVVHTSTAPEPLGRVMLESMVLAKPVIATALGGPLEIIEDGITGFLVPHGNPEMLAHKIDFLITHPSIANLLGKRAQEHVIENFNIDKNIRKIEQIYENLLTPRA